MLSKVRAELAECLGFEVVDTRGWEQVSILAGGAIGASIQLAEVFCCESGLVQVPSASSSVR